MRGIAAKRLMIIKNIFSNFSINCEKYLILKMALNLYSAQNHYFCKGIPNINTLCDDLGLIKVSAKSLLKV